VDIMRKNDADVSFGGNSIWWMKEQRAGGWAI